VIYLSPPVTMLWGWSMFGEPLSTAMFVGLAVTLFGVWFTSSRRAAWKDLELSQQHIG